MKIFHLTNINNKKESFIKNDTSSNILISRDRCFICLKWFTSKNIRDQHLVIHFTSISAAIMENIDEIYCSMTGKFFKVIYIIIFI